MKDQEDERAYYIERLGFQLDFQGPDDGLYYGGVSRDGIGVLQSPQEVAAIEECRRPENGLAYGR